MQTNNPFKRALSENQRQIGLWCSLASNVTAEVVAGAGFDWLLLDIEHSPNDLRSILTQLQAVAPYPVEPIVRLPVADVVLIKQFLDAGVRSLLLPNINSVEEAKTMVASTRFPPLGTRGVSVAQRANRYGRVPNYHQTAHHDICMVLQIETPEAVQAAEDIAAIEGVDALFVGPADLSSNMGHLVQPNVEEVQQAILSVQAAARRQNKAAGILAPVHADADRYLEAGFAMVGVGSDQGLLASSADALAARFK